MSDAMFPGSPALRPALVIAASWLLTAAAVQGFDGAMAALLSALALFGLPALWLAWELGNGAPAQAPSPRSVAHR